MDRIIRKRTKKGLPGGSELELIFDFQLHVFNLPRPVIEHKFHKDRRFRFDYAWPKQKIYVELEGGTWINGGHSRGKGFESDCEKYNLATMDGWRGLRFTTNMVRDGLAIETTRAFFKRETG